MADGHFVACDVASLTLRRLAPIPAGVEPGSTSSPGIRVTLSPDGKQLTFVTRSNQTSEVWMLDNFHAPGGLWTGWKLPRLYHPFSWRRLCRIERESPDR